MRALSFNSKSEVNFTSNSCNNVGGNFHFPNFSLTLALPFFVNDPAKNVHGAVPSALP